MYLFDKQIIIGQSKIGRQNLAGKKINIFLEMVIFLSLFFYFITHIIVKSTFNRVVSSLFCKHYCVYYLLILCIHCTPKSSKHLKTTFRVFASKKALETTNTTLMYFPCILNLYISPCKTNAKYKFFVPPLHIL